MELLVPLDGRSQTPMYEQIYRFIREEIRKGNLKAGERLPSSRILSENLKVSRSTVQLAYDQLSAEGYMETVPYKGCFIADTEGLFKLEEGQSKTWTEGFLGSKEEERRSEWKGSIDFSPRGIDLENFPFGVWRKLNRDTLVDDNREIFGAGDPRGEMPLREAIRSYLHSARGVNCRAEQIIVGAGSEYLLMLLSRVLGDGHRIAMEDPTYKQAYRVLSGQGYPVCPIHMDKYGMRTALLRKSGADVAYVMPSHQYPTGIVMPVKRRQELLNWAYEQEGRYLIEDDYDSEFRYKGMPIPALQGMDQKGRVIYIGTFSKSIAPAIRIGFLVLPPSLLEIYEKKASFYSSTVSRIDQNVLYQFLVKGHYERHLNRMRAVYKGKHDVLLGALKKLEDRFTIYGEHAGLHVLLKHKQGLEEETLIRLAAEKGVRVYGLSSYFISEDGKQDSSTLVLGYATLTQEEIEEGAGLLNEAWKEETNGINHIVLSGERGSISDASPDPQKT